MHPNLNVIRTKISLRVHKYNTNRQISNTICDRDLLTVLDCTSIIPNFSRPASNNQKHA